MLVLLLLLVCWCCYCCWCVSVVTVVGVLVLLVLLVVLLLKGNIQFMLCVINFAVWKITIAELEITAYTGHFQQ